MSPDAGPSSDSGGPSASSWPIIYLKGIFMGAADAVPGVSGGTIALITGIYERLIGAVTAISPTRVLDVLRGLVPGGRASARSAFREMDGWFLLTLGAGIATAVVSVTRVLSWAIDAIPVTTFGFFFGLIGASAFVLFDQVRLDTRGRIAAAAAGFLLAFVVSGRSAATLGTSAMVTFVAGAIAVSAMILPGISGSLLLIILGQYEYMVDALKQFVDGLLGLVDGGALTTVLEPGTTVIVFVGGAVVGLFTIAHVVRWALDARREATLAFLVSLIVGALRAPVEKVDEAIGGAWSSDVVLAFLLAAAVGGGLVWFLDRVAGLGEEY
jgi:putative membrane protein